MPLLRGIQRSALGGAAAAAARGRLPLPTSYLAGGALRSGSSPMLFLSLLFLFLLGSGGALRSHFFSSAYPTAAGTTSPADPRPASARVSDPHELASLRVRRSSLPPDEICGGISDAPGRETDPDAIDLARFAVAEHNSKKNAALEFVRLVKVKEQVVAGIMYYFTVEVRGDDGGANKLYEAKVWLRPWEKFKGLHAFEPVANAADQGENEGSTVIGSV